jgi:hypothetical protein
MTKKATTTTTADVEKEKTSVSTSKTTRIVLDVPTASIERFKILCNLVGDTQSNMVTKAMDTYVAERKELIDQFVALRTKINK